MSSNESPFQPVHPEKPPGVLCDVLGYIGYVVLAIDFGLFHQFRIVMRPNIPVDQFVCLLAIDHYVFRHRHRFILKRMAIGGEPPASAGGPACALRLDQNNVVNKLKPMLVSTC